MDAPQVNYMSDRVVGLELEFDAAGARFVAPALPLGWTSMRDGSVYNGLEFILTAMPTLSESRPYMRAFSDALKTAKTKVGIRGGYHVHVQAADFSIDDAERLVLLYTHFQPTINKLLAPSRTGNNFCPAYAPGVNKATLTRMFRLSSPANNRSEAKCSRSYSVINLAMLRCVTPAHRSVEFRQGSPSKRFININGWASFVTLLVDLCKSAPDIADEAMRVTTAGGRSVAALVRMVRKFERHCGQSRSSGVAKWVKWRHDYMQEDEYSPEMKSKLLEILRTPLGLFSIAEKCKINNAVAKRIVEKALAAGDISRTGVRFQVHYNRVAEVDLAELEAVATSEVGLPNGEAVSVNEQPVVLTSSPTSIPNMVTTAILSNRVRNLRRRPITPDVPGE